MENNISKIKFLEIKKEIIINKNGIKVNDLTIKNSHSYCVSKKNIIVHNCTTWPTTGFGSRNCQASTIEECSKYYVPIIADGGIKVPADIAKSIVLGASMVMVGGLMSGFKDSPGNLINLNGVKKKEFWGSASQFQSNKTNRIEGTKILVDYKDKSILDEMIFLQECLQSSISYGGGNNLSSLRNVEWK
jgi:GMP reductase